MNLRNLSVVPASHLESTDPVTLEPEAGQIPRRGDGFRSRWRLRYLAGKLAELTGSQGSLSLVTSLIREAQTNREVAAWITAHPDTFYPPDLADNGVALETLPVIFAKTGREAFRSAEILVRSGAFSLIIIDLGRNGTVPAAYQGRLVRLSQHHNAAVVALTVAPSGGLGSMVSVRLEPRRTRLSAQLVRYEAQATKDKRNGPGWIHAARYRSLAGLR
ncbi:MAG: hypothetical protein ACLFO1_06650 [Spirochaetaceae bacterium]